MDRISDSGSDDMGSSPVEVTKIDYIMKIFINKKEMEFAGDLVSVRVLLSSLNIGEKGVAVAIGTAVVARDEWDNPIIGDGADITIIRATQGG